MAVQREDSVLGSEPGGTERAVFGPASSEELYACLEALRDRSRGPFPTTRSWTSAPPPPATSGSTTSDAAPQTRSWPTATAPPWWSATPTGLPGTAPWLTVRSSAPSIGSWSPTPRRSSPASPRPASRRGRRAPAVSPPQTTTPTSCTTTTPREPNRCPTPSNAPQSRLPPGAVPSPPDGRSRCSSTTSATATRTSSRSSDAKTTTSPWPHGE